MEAFFIFPEGHTLMVAGAALILNETFRNMNLDATAKDYWDDFASEVTVEYGVAVRANGLSNDEWAQLVHNIAKALCDMYGTVEVEVS